MTRRKLRHELKQAVDKSEHWLMIAQLGNQIGVNDADVAEQSMDARAIVIQELTLLKQNISKLTDAYTAEIELSINKLR